MSQVPILCTVFIFYQKASLFINPSLPVVSRLKVYGNGKENDLNTFSVFLDKMGQTLLIYFPPKKPLQTRARDAAQAEVFSVQAVPSSGVEEHCMLATRPQSTDVGVMSKNKFPAMNPLNHPASSGFIAQIRLCSAWGGGGVCFIVHAHLCISGGQLYQPGTRRCKIGPNDSVHRAFLVQRCSDILASEPFYTL